MAIQKKRPLTPAQRFYIAHSPDNINKRKPERLLLKANHRSKGRNCYGRITSRRRGGGHKRLYRLVDFKREKIEIPAIVKSIEYDPNRSSNIALLSYLDGEKRYILAPKGIKIGDTVLSTQKAMDKYDIGLCMPLRLIPPATLIHAIEIRPGSGAKIARGAGSAVQLINVDNNQATLKMPSGEIRYVHSSCRATIGSVGNADHQLGNIGKAGRSRWIGKKPRVRGVAMNPVDHPMGGGEGKTSGGGHPRSPWGQFAKGYPTRKKAKYSNKMIVTRRNGRKVKSK